MLGADLSQLADDVAMMVEGGADWLHVDVMDGRFVPNLTFGASMIAALRKLCDLPLDVHLMVLEPENYIQPFADAGADVFTFHPEATTHAQRHLDVIRKTGMQAGLSLNPATPLTAVEYVVDDLDLLLVMSVNPGFGGQSYIPSANVKLMQARRMLDRAGSQASLEVDGGVSRNTIADAHAAGADTFVVGSAIFGAPEPSLEIAELRRRCIAEA
jgi:ribulose-phosphate 3-epimerase